MTLEEIYSKYLKVSDGFLLLSLLFSVFYWLAESGLHAFVFGNTTFIQSIFYPGQHELLMRLTTVVIFLIFGIYAKYTVVKIKQERKKIRAAYSELDQIFNTAADAMRVVDSEFNIMRVNNTFAKLVGVKKEELIGRKCYDIFWGPQCHTLQCPLARIVQGEKFVETDVIKEAVGDKKIACIVTAKPFYDKDNKLIGVVEDYRNITERKLMENKIRESERRFRQLYKQLPVPTYVWQKQNSKFILIDYNLAAEKLTKNYINGYRYKSAKEMYRNRPDILSDLNKCFNKKSFFSREIEYKTAPMKGRRHFIANYAFIYPNIILVHTQDITAIKKAEAILKESKIELERRIKEKTKELELTHHKLLKTEKMAALGRMASAIAHELRNPLATIKLAVYSSRRKINVLKIEKKNKEKILKHFEHIDTEVAESDRIIHDLLTFSKIPKMSFSKANINNIINAVLKENQRCIKEHKLSVVKKFDKYLPDIKIDIDKISEVLCNMFLNAAQAMVESEKKELQITTREIDNFIEIEISDSGHGITEDNLKKLGEPFFSTRIKGIGLGLYISYQIINKHKGRVEVRSKIDKGTSFTIFLPIE